MNDHPASPRSISVVSTLNHSFSHLRLARSAFVLGSFALALVATGAPAQPSPATAKELKAATKAVEQNKLDEAERIFSAIAMREPSEVRAKLGLADIAYREGRFQESELIIRQAVADFSKDPGVHVALGRFLYAQKRFKEAEDALISARELEDAAYIDVDLGTLYAEALDRPVDAMDYFYRAIAKDPKLPGAHYALGQVLFSQNQFDEARAQFEIVVRLDSKNVFGWIGMGRSQVRAGRPYAAVMAYEKAAQLAPKSFLITLERADLDTALGKDEAALRGYEEAVKLDPKSFSAWSKLGMFHQVHSHLADADAAYAKALAIDPKSALVLNNRAALALAGFGHISDGIPLAKQAVELSPDNPYFLDTLGELLEKNGQLDEARRVLTTARQADPKYLAPRYHLAIVLHRQGKIAEARALLEEPLKGDHAFPERADFEKLLAKINASPAK